jgi:hypothetical protein
MVYFKVGHVMTGFRSKAAASKGITIMFPEKSIKILESSTVDGSQWYTISCLRNVSIWLRETYADEEDQTWFQNIDEKWQVNYNVFDVHEHILTAATLRWA